MNSDDDDFHEEVRSLTTARMLGLLALVVAIGIGSALTGDFAVTALCALLAAALGGYIAVRRR